MKRLGIFLLRIFTLWGLVVALTVIVFLARGGGSKSALSDWLVYVSFITFTAGTLAGILRFGVTEPPIGPSSRFEVAVKGLFRQGPFGIALTLAGVLCFLTAMLVDLLF